MLDMCSGYQFTIPFCQASTRSRTTKRNLTNPEQISAMMMSAA
jgi:hypothetical protein